MSFSIALMRKITHEMGVEVTHTRYGLTPCKRKYSCISNEDYCTPVFQKFIRIVGRAQLLMILTSMIKESFPAEFMQIVVNNPQISTEQIKNFRQHIEEFHRIMRDCDRCISFEQFYTLDYLLSTVLKNFLTDIKPLYMKLYFKYKLLKN